MDDGWGLSAQPLPPADPIDPDPAYESVLRYEQRASHLRAHGPISHTVAARVLGYLLLHPISPAGRERIAADVSYCCEVDARLYRLGLLFVKYFVHHFRSKAIATSESDTSAPTRKVKLDDYIEACKGPDNVQYKAKTLLRDDFRCSMTGYTDNLSVERGLTRPSTSNVTVKVAEFLPRNKVTRECVAVLYRIGAIPDARVHDPHTPRNLIAVSEPINLAMNKLRLCLEPIPLAATHGPNDTQTRYRLTGPRGAPRDCLPEIALRAFEDPRTGLSIPPPDPVFIRTHAVCCRVAHLSGANDALSKLYANILSTSVLEEDGSSAGLLHGALALLAG
ncbi:uncharacterized protein SCHCODRAFT_02690838 [Schizophyllum commune H4-8]|uniref:uncharacterized protein n=1 Tax=Schizophyllum commune (strain H4-8 / FGSC 9210) TaxID=578458 RepID=UPI00215ECB7D|nr:uncharacterized protein SCHCODRAFT_02690838 [Schizophyllum commune H4-8]KAI5889003.1 hypothetical protein SCHCODRAFT_02690838 [Schizophyllum commune H4-8]